MPSRYAILMLTAGLGFLWGCKTPDPGLFRTPEPQGANVIDRLRHDSERSVEPFLSLAVQEAERLGPAIIADFVTAIRQHPDRRSFLALIVLRRFDKQQGSSSVEPRIQALVLADALRSHLTYNGWGFPGRSQSEAALAFVSLGPDIATPALLPLLADARRAPHWGSADATVAAEEELRVKDYAAWILSLTAKRPYEHVPFARVRDARIDTLRGLVESR